MLQVAVIAASSKTTHTLLVGGCWAFIIQLPHRRQFSYLMTSSMQTHCYKLVTLLFAYNK